MGKKKKVSTIAKGKLARAVVLRGSKAKTASGLTASALMKNKRGKVVSKANHATRKKMYQGSKAQAWAKACSQARKQLNLKGFGFRRQDSCWQGLVCQGQGHLQRLKHHACAPSVVPALQLWSVLVSRPLPHSTLLVL